MYNLILFGPPGAGKGTQAVKIAAQYGWKHISTGDILRSEVSRGTPLGLKVREVMDAGHLVSDELLIEIMESVFIGNSDAKGFVLDGFPRTLNQARELDRMLERYNRKVTRVLALTVDEEELVKRILKRAQEQGRLDDSEEAVKNRLIQYHHHTEPLIDYYKNAGIFRELYGIGTVEEIFDQLCTAIDA